MAQATTQAVGTSYTRPYRSLADFISINGVKAQTFTVDPSRQTTIIGQKGTRFTFFPYSLVDTQGTIIKQTVELQLKEVFSKEDMILSDKVTTSEDRLLESSGQFWLQAMLDGAPLQLKTAVVVELPVRKNLKNPLGMKLFQGSMAVTRTFGGSTAFDWKLLSKKPIPINKVAKRKFYKFLINTFNWYNCDCFFAKRTAKTMVSIRVQQGMKQFDELSAYLVFREANAVSRMYAHGNRFTSFNIPSRKRATVLLLGLKNGQFYSCAKELEHTGNQVLSLAPEPCTEQVFLDWLKQI